MKINILLFWFSRNWGEGRTYQKVAEHLSKKPEVKNVVCVFHPNPVKEDKWAWPMAIKRIGRKLILVSQNRRMIPTSSRPFRLRVWINRCALQHALLTYLRMCGFRKNNTIHWLFPPHPYLDELIRTIPHHLLVAHIVDNFANFREDKWLHDHAAMQYPKLQRDADVIITGSEFNHRLFSAGRKHCYLFENAVDEAFIGEPSSLPYLEGSCPRLGYIGTISQRTDLDLLKYMACQKPNWIILIAGRQELSLHENGLMDLPNIHYLGIIPYSELPKFLKSLDVCLIPHKNTDYCKSMSPLKLYQYMASGRPIVSTNIEGLGKLKEHLWIGKSSHDFVKGIEKALQEDTIKLSNRRIEAARTETWDKRVQDMFAVVKKCFMGKQLAT
jgi:glycosyltransferase involved in cell wall biosynthesis